MIRNLTTGEVLATHCDTGTLFRDFGVEGNGRIRYRDLIEVEQTIWKSELFNTAALYWALYTRDGHGVSRLSLMRL